MATSEVQIVNSALDKLGEEAIASFDDDSKAARLMKRQYPIQRDYLQRRHRWNFTIGRFQLAPEATDPKFGFENQFMLPDKTLAFLGIYDDNEPQRNYTTSTDSYKMEGRLVLYDGDQLDCFVRTIIEDPNQFDPMFTEVLSERLAWKTAYKLTDSPRKERAAREDYTLALREARLADSIDTQPEIVIASDWIDSREVSGRGPFREGPIQ